MYAAALTRALRVLEPGVRVYGLGGDRLRESGGELVGHYEGLAATGISEAFTVVSRSYAIYRRIVSCARVDRPDVFVAIDFPEVNFRIAAAIRKLGIPVVYYIGPQVWAWRRSRLETMRRFVDLALVIFPFEAVLYQEAGIPVEFVGHPLLDLTTPTESRSVFLGSIGLAPTAPTVALLPGSRPNELRAILPDLTASARLIRERLGEVQFVLARAPNLDDSLFSSVLTLKRAGVPLHIVEGRADDVLAAADVVVTASGTATVQAAIHQRPMVIVYRLSALTYWLVKTFSHVENAGMVNLIAGQQIVPELLQEKFTPSAVAAEVAKFLTDSAATDRTIDALAGVRSKLGTAGASRRTAERVMAFAKRGNA